MFNSKKISLTLLIVVFMCNTNCVFANNQQQAIEEVPQSLTAAEWSDIQAQIIASGQTDYQQQAFLKASNPDAGDDFSYGSVAISGDTLVVGTPFEDSNTTDINGDETNNDANSAGAVYVFFRNAGVWSQQAYLKASNTGNGDEFGSSVAISEDTIVVGASREDSNSTSVNGDESNNDASASGAVYVFTRSAGQWSQQAYLKSSNSEAGDRFGWSVAISGNKIVVGANLEDSDATGVNGDENNNNESDSGVAYVFIRSAGIWSQEAYLKASNASSFDYFGFDVAISGNTIVVGASSEDSGSIGVDGDENNNDAFQSGAAYVFKYGSGNWQQQAYLKASNTDDGDNFGHAVDISGNTIVIGAYREESNSSEINGDETNNDSDDAGAAYVFIRSLGLWSQQAYLKAFNTDDLDYFATSVSISGNTIVVGADFEDSNASGVDSDGSNNDLPASGAAYVFMRSSGVWHQQHYLKPEHPESFYLFGDSVDISGNTIVVSEHKEGVIINNSGAAHVFNQAIPYSLNVAVTGLLSAGLVLQNNGTDDLSVLNNGISQFATELLDGSNYQVTISSQPNNDTCIIDGNSRGVVSSANVLVEVRCADFIFVDDFE